MPRRLEFLSLPTATVLLRAAAVERAMALGCCILIAAVALAGSSARGEEPAKPAAKAPASKPKQPAPPPAAAKAPPANSLDAALLEDLDNDLLEGVKNLPPAKKDAARGDDATSGDDATAGENAGEMPAAGDESGEEPLIRIGQQMRTAEKLIDQKRPAERVQDQILTDLAALIKKIEEQAQSQSSSSGKSPNPQEQASARDQVKQPQSGSGNPGTQPSQKPAKESTDRLGKNDVQRPDAESVRSMLKEAWGQLPPHAREQMLQSPPEQFLPKYELLIEKYYKRLADQQQSKP